MYWYQAESSQGGVEAVAFISEMMFGGGKEDGVQGEHTVFRMNFIFILIDNVSIL